MDHSWHRKLSRPQLASPSAVAQNSSPLTLQVVRRGWCSWVCYAASISFSSPLCCSSTDMGSLVLEVLTKPDHLPVARAQVAGISRLSLSQSISGFYTLVSPTCEKLGELQVSVYLKSYLLGSEYYWLYWNWALLTQFVTLRTVHI